MGHDADPTDHPPPCNQSRTGSEALCSSVGVQMLRTRQSSLVHLSTARMPVRGSASRGISMPVNWAVVICGHEGP